MSLMQQQRLIGVILLVSIISGIAFFFMSNANNNSELIPKQDTPEIKPSYTSVVEAIPEGDIEIINDDSEALVNSHDLPITDVKADVKKEKKQAERKKYIKENIPAPVTDNVSSGWLLQLGSFSVKENANKMQQHVATLGYKANIEAVKTSSGSVYRVRIGPKNTKSEIDTIANVLNQRLKIRSQVIKKEN